MLTTAGSGPRESVLFAYYVSGAGPLLRDVMRRSRSKRETLLAKSLQELEGDFWGPIGAGETHLIRECLRLRKVPLSQLTDSNLRLLIGQQIGLQHLVPLALERLKTNPWSDSLYPGDLLAAVLRVDAEFWRGEPALLAWALSIAHSAVGDWEQLGGGPKSLTGFRYVKKSLAELEAKTHENA
ncbi:MAG TPA: contact-dependent growth inhibition system immunity protein [Verrucomicrobiae bacterium]